MAAQRLLYGVGKGIPKGASTTDRSAAYTSWHHMIERCYSPVLHKKYPTYVGTYVCPEWHDFSVFEKWFELNHRPGYALDKDLKFIGNKCYSPETCSFVPQWLNNVLLDSAASRGALPLGVSKDRGRYKVRCSIGGKATYIGMYPTVMQAHQAYVKAKIASIFQAITNVLIPSEIRNSLWLVALSMKLGDKV